MLSGPATRGLCGLLAVTLLLDLLTQTHPPTARRRGRDGVIFAAAPGSVRPAPGGDDAGPERVARRFAGAYLRWEVGHARLRDVRTLLELSTPHLAASSFDQPPRLSSARRPPAQARLVSVAVTRQSSAPDIAVAQAVISRAGRRDRLTMALTVDGASARVATLVPPYGGRG